MTTMIVEDLGRIPMSPYLTATLTRAADYATAQSHREVTLEHLLLALAEDPEASVVLRTSSIDLARLTAEVSDHLGRSDDRVSPENGQSIAISADLRRILEAAAAAARQGRRREINGAIVLAAIVGDGKSTAAHLLRMQGLTFEAAIRALQRSAAPTPEPSPAASEPSPRPHPPEPRLQPQPEAPLEAPPPRPAQPPAAFEAKPPMPAPDLSRPATTEEILASARERLQSREEHDGDGGASSAGSPLPRANYPDRGGPPRPPVPARDGRVPGHDEPALPDDEPVSSPEASSADGDRPPTPEPADTHPASDGDGRPALPPKLAEPARYPPPPSPQRGPSFQPGPPAVADTAGGTRRGPGAQSAGRPAPQADARRAGAGAGAGSFVGSWPLIEAGHLIENIPRRMRASVPVVVEARIARADVKALAEGLAGGGAAFRHEIVVTKAMSVRLRAPDGGFVIENRSPETQWIENVLSFGSDDYASWRWTVTPRARGRRQLQLIVSARTVGADGMTAETALPDQVVDVKISINYARTAARWAGWGAAALIGALLAKFGDMAWLIVQVLFAKYFGG